MRSVSYLRTRWGVVVLMALTQLFPHTEGKDIEHNYCFIPNICQKESKADINWALASPLTWVHVECLSTPFKYTHYFSEYVQENRLPFLRPSLAWVQWHLHSVRVHCWENKAGESILQLWEAPWDCSRCRERLQTLPPGRECSAGFSLVALWRSRRGISSERPEF